MNSLDKFAKRDSEAGGGFVTGNESHKILPPNNLGRNPFVSGSEYEVTVDSTQRAVLDLSFVPRGVIVLESEVLCTASILKRQGRLTTISFSQIKEHLSTIEVTGTASAQFDVALDGDLDQFYEVEGVTLGSAAYVSLTINGSDITVDGKQGYLTGGITAYTTSARIAANSSSSIPTHSRTYFRAKTGSNRLIESTTHTPVYATDQYLRFLNEWENSTIKVTSLGLSATGAFGSGSIYHLSRLRPFNNTKIKLWIY